MTWRNVWRGGVALALFIGLFAPACAADYDCNSLATDLASTEGGRVYYYADTGVWTPLTPVSNFESNTVVHLLYVTREMIEPARFGSVVIKTGRDLTVADAPTRGSLSVALHRPKSELADDPCATDMKTASFEGSVPSPSYDFYHDTNARLGNDTDRDALDNFHIRYTARRKICLNTNDTKPDSLIAFDFRTNRTQFSFDPFVVDNGVPPALAQAIVPRASAARMPLADQSVTIRRYKVTSGQATCVPFDERVRGKGFFIRVNDLEARASDFFRLYRTGEHRYILQY